jgi:tRNA (uracil-5-)-methyltransferase
VSAACPHFGTCGGCAALDVEYAAQVRAKQETLQRLFGQDVPFEPSPDVVYYRNRMDYSFGGGGAGLFMKGNWRHVVDLQSCLLLSPEAIPTLRFARAEADRLGFPDYDRRRHTGFLRYLVLREAKATGEKLASLVTAEGLDAAPLCEALFRERRLDSVIWQVNDGKADLSRGTIRRVWGRDRIVERFGDMAVTFFPNSFLQPNTRAAALLYRDLRELVPAGSRLLDLYCGVGAIGLAVEARCSKVVGVDLDPENIAAAKANSSTIEFVQADAGQAELAGFNVLVLDPPRAGLHPKLAKRLAREAPPRIVYVSCNPEALRRDVELLGYRLVSLRGYDFCPHTRHIEALALLERSEGVSGAAVPAT